MTDFLKFAYDDPSGAALRASELASSQFFAQRLRAGKLSIRIVALVLRDGDACQLCHQPILFEDDKRWAPSVDHIVPKSHEGQNRMRNYRLMHVWCNNRLGSTDCPNCATGICAHRMKSA